MFCINQLGGVGHRWGQAAGPGNRGGVKAGCKALAAESRRLYPQRPKQGSGYGHTTVFRSLARLAAPQACPFGLDPSGSCLNPCIKKTNDQGLAYCDISDQVCPDCCGTADQFPDAQDCKSCVNTTCKEGHCGARTGCDGDPTCQWDERIGACVNDCVAVEKEAARAGWDPQYGCNAYTGDPDYVQEDLLPTHPCKFSDDGSCRCDPGALGCTNGPRGVLGCDGVTEEACRADGSTCAWISGTSAPGTCMFNCSMAKDQDTCESDAFSTPCSWTVDPSTNEGYCGCKPKYFSDRTCTMTDPVCQFATTSEVCNGPSALLPNCARDTTATNPVIDGSPCKFNCALATDQATCEGDPFSSACLWVTTQIPGSPPDGYCECNPEQIVAGTCFTDPAPQRSGGSSDDDGCSSAKDETSCRDLSDTKKHSCIWFDGKCLTDCAVPGQSNCNSIEDTSGNKLCIWGSLQPADLRGQCGCRLSAIRQDECYDGEFSPPALEKEYRCTAVDEYTCIANALCEWAPGGDGPSCGCSQKTLNDPTLSRFCKPLPGT